MSPLYEFYCHECRYTKEELRQMGDFSPPACDNCDGETEYVISLPTMHVWEAGKYFPNVAPEGDGGKTFDTKREYNEHLKKHNMAECSTDAPKRHKPGTQVTVFK